MIPASTTRRSITQAKAPFTGHYGSTSTDARYQVLNGRSVRFWMTRALSPGEAMTIVAGWPKAIIRQPAFSHDGKRLVYRIQDPDKSMGGYRAKAGIYRVQVRGGDSNFVTNSMVTTALGNGILFTDGVSWLTDFGEQITFAPQAYSVGVPLIFVSQQTLDLIAFITIILMPGAVLVSGLAIWARRVRR